MDPVDVNALAMKRPGEFATSQDTAPAASDAGTGPMPPPASHQSPTGLRPDRPSEAGVAERSAPGLASLLSQARATQVQLSSQPLPITNHDANLIMKLLGG